MAFFLFKINLALFIEFVISFFLISDTDNGDNDELCGRGIPIRFVESSMARDGTFDTGLSLR